MKYRFWLFKRAGVYYVQDAQTRRKESLQTTDKREAERLRAAKNESYQQPTLNLALGKTYLSAHDPEIMKRDWSMVMDYFCSHRGETTRLRNSREVRGKPYDPIRHKKLVETTTEDFFRVLEAGGKATNHFLRRLHNLALDLGWLPWAILPKKVWPKDKPASKRAITWEEYQQIIAAETKQERKQYYQMLWEIGASQTDTVKLRADNVNWQDRVLNYQRQKTGEWAFLYIGPSLENLLKTLPSKGPLFPNLLKRTASDRSSEFHRRCRLLGIEGISLHSFRYSWAERAKTAGYPERWAQSALGHNSRAVHAAYAKKAKVTCPSLEDYEKKIIPMPQSKTFGN